MTVNYRTPLLLLFSLFLIGFKIPALSQIKSVSPIVFKAPSNFRVVGYLLIGHIKNDTAKHFDLSRINYLNIFFDNLNSHQKFYHVLHLESTIANAHKNHVLVLGTIGNQVDLSLLTDDKRKGFIDSLIESADELHLDGIDIDFEGSHIDGSYEAFVTDLSAALKPKNKLLTAAVATRESKQLSDKALSYFDFLNIMSYDNVLHYEVVLPLNATSILKIYKAGQHSSLGLAISDLEFWTNIRGIAKEKLNLGLPFYGYAFVQGKRSKFTYQSIINKHPGNENNDTIKVTGGYVIYNGIQTIKKKTSLAMQYAGGVAVWELMEDATENKSLLSAIDQTANPDNH